ncbi:MAG TPA: hypothetical protein VKQ08_09465 [Cyclobacteriaceae bacterium]|nr:hypothetical protein [Cyclobacteriaceae bacterium]
MNLAKCFTICLLWFIPIIGFGQRGCTQKVSIISIRDVNGEGTKVEFEVASKGSFRGKVVGATTANEEIVREFSGAGNERITVTNLDKNLLTTVFLEFDGEKNFLCKSKVLPDIFSTDKR